jgi:hypothetical protein
VKNAPRTRKATGILLMTRVVGSGIIQAGQ